MSSDLPPILKVDEVAAYLRISRSSAYDLIKRGELPVVRVGGRIRITRHAIEDMLRGD